MKRSHGKASPAVRCTAKPDACAARRARAHAAAARWLLRRPLLSAGYDDAQGERRLALAVLTEAVQCFQKHAIARDPRGRRLFREAEQWLMSGAHEPEFSFEGICEALRLDPNYLRNGLQRWRERQQRAG